jgi:hypothetical protein
MDEHVGRIARCLNCGKRFYVPSIDGAKAREYMPPVCKPEPYFFHRAFLSSWKLFLVPGNLVIFLLICVAVTAKYFLGTQDYSFAVFNKAINIPLGWVSNFLVWGFLFWYYMEMIRAAAVDESDLPEPDIGRGLAFTANAFVSIYFFVVAFFLAELPFIILLSILSGFGLESDFLNIVLFMAGFQLFPMVVLIIALGQPWQVFNPKNIIKPIVKAPLPYFSVSLGVTLLWGLQWETLSYYNRNVFEKSAWQIVIEILSLIAIQTGMIILMRSTGLFFHHYRCYIPFVDRD